MGLRLEIFEIHRRRQYAGVGVSILYTCLHFLYTNTLINTHTHIQIRTRTCICTKMCMYICLLVLLFEYMPRARTALTLEWMGGPRPSGVPGIYGPLGGTLIEGPCWFLGAFEELPRSIGVV